MKKALLVALVLSLALVMAFTLTACGGDSGGGQTGGQTGGQNVFTPPPPPASPAAPAGGGATEAPAAPEVPADPQPGPNERTHNFTWAHPYPATHQIHVQIIMPLVDEILAASNGTINITVIPAGAITTTATAVDDVTTAAVDLTWTLPGNTPGRFPLLTCIEFSDHFDSAVEATQTIWELLYVSRNFQDEFANYKLFSAFTTEMGDIYTIDQVRTPADLAGMNLRAASPMSERMLRAFGANTVGMGMPDVYDNIERGVIVGLATARSAIAQYNLQEVLDHGTYGLNLYTTTQIMAMSWSAWNRMSEWQQWVFDSVTGLDLSLRAAALYDEMGEVARNNIPGLQLNRLSDSELAAFEALSSEVINDYLADLEALGYDAQGHYAQMLDIRDNVVRR